MPPTNVFNPDSPCPCGNPLTYTNCCQPYLTGKALAPTAESLMRSRYSAHCLLAIDYLWDTWAPAQRIRSSKQSIRDWACACEWLGLNILSTKEGSATDNQGIVEFKAHYRLDGENQTHHEISVFTKISGAWFYVDHQA